MRTSIPSSPKKRLQHSGILWTSPVTECPTLHGYPRIPHKSLATILALASTVAVNVCLYLHSLNFLNRRNKFVAMHIRRGDKIVKEAAAVETQVRTNKRVWYTALDESEKAIA